MLNDGQLSGGEGSVLDPVVAIRHHHAAARPVCDGRHRHRHDRAARTALHLIDKYQDRHLADRVFELAWTHSQVVLRQLNASEADAQLYGRLATW
jgi:cellobiose phosphorylase